MSYFLQKPENALKRAKELISVPNVDVSALKRTKRSALEILHDALIAKKSRIWQQNHEELMLLYLDICVELQLGRIAKDGLHQYRNLSIQNNPASLETVIVHFIQVTEKNLACARQQSNELIILAAAKVDLEAVQTPEAVMLSTTTFENATDRTNREVVVPWLRFTWEAYRTVLDILKCNTKLEGLYKSITMKAFDFCVEYTRKIEFRRLCEILRAHLGSLQKHSGTPSTQILRSMRSWDGFTLESVENLLEMRYRQFQVATDLELYSEAYRTIDDINVTMNLIEQTPRLDLMISYFEKLAQIFLVSKNYLFHAYALYKWYCLRAFGVGGMEANVIMSSVQPLVPADEQLDMATRVVLASLSVPLLEFEATTPVFGDDTLSLPNDVTETSSSLATLEKNARMASLLGFATIPTRSALMSRIISAGIVKRAMPEVASLYQFIELQEVDPLQIVKLVIPSLDKLRGDSKSCKTMWYKAYLNNVERLLVRRVLFQLTGVYSSVTIEHLKSLFVGLDVTYQEIEQLIVRSRSLSTIAHNSAPNLSSLYLQQDENNNELNAANALKTKIRIDHVHQCIQFTDSWDMEANSTQLISFGERLGRLISKVNPSNAISITRRKELFSTTKSNLAESRKIMLSRKDIIEQRKEELECLQQLRLQTIEKKRQEIEQLRQKMEKERLEQEAQRREMEKRQKIKEEMALMETKQMLDRLGRKDLDTLDLENLDHEAILNETKELAQKAKEEAQRKLRDVARRLDYMIRATREAEQPILVERFSKLQEEALVTYEQEKAEKTKRDEEEHAFGLKEKARFAVASEVSTAFSTAHKSRRHEVYLKISEEQKEKLKIERLAARVARAKERHEAEQRKIHLENEKRRREEEERQEQKRLQAFEEEAKKQKEEEDLRVQEESKLRHLENEKQVESEAPSAYRPPVDRQSSARRTDVDEGEWKRAGPKTRSSDDRWDRGRPLENMGNSGFGFSDRGNRNEGRRDVSGPSPSESYRSRANYSSNERSESFRSSGRRLADIGEGGQYGDQDKRRFGEEPRREYNRFDRIDDSTNSRANWRREGDRQDDRGYRSSSRGRGEYNRDPHINDADARRSTHDDPRRSTHDDPRRSTHDDPRRSTHEKAPEGRWR